MKKILYVEDNVDTATAVKIILSHAGYDVETASRGKEGIRLAEKGKFNLILLDIMLPDMSGWDIFEQLHKKVKAKYAFLSAIPVSAERIKELRKSGVSEYIIKPFDKEDLLQKIKRMIK
jgi:DNA-binding response OmpR family regulator